MFRNVMDRTSLICLCCVVIYDFLVMELVFKIPIIDFYVSGLGISFPKIKDNKPQTLIYTNVKAMVVVISHLIFLWITSHGLN